MVKKITSLLLGLILVFLNVSSSYAYYTYMPASVVVGQSDFTSNTTGLTQSLFGSSLRGIYVDPNGRLLVSDSGNNRVLVWNKVPTTNGAPADLVLGQADFSSGTANRGGTLNSNTLNGPVGIWSDGNKLMIADEANHRILYWRSFPTSNGQAADIVIGQTDFITATTNNCNALNPRFPNSIIVYNGKLLVSSRTAPGNRIMIWNSIPESNGVSANNVIGQPNLTTCNAASTSSTGLNSPRQMDVSDDGKLFVADNSNVRILIYNSIPTTDGAAADVVVGQSSFTATTTQTTSNGLSNPFGVSIGGNRLVIGDQTNNRLLIYNTIPTSNSASADIVIGSTNFTSIITGVTDRHFRLHHIYATSSQIFVIDPVNARVVIFNNVESPPKITLDSIISIPGDALKALGSVRLGERGKYTLQNIRASVNDDSFSDVVNKDSGQEFGADETLYKFFYEFLPWANNNGTKETWNSNGYTLRIKTSSYNAEEANVFYFYPFTLNSVSDKLFQFEGPKAHWQKLKDNLNSFEIHIQKNGDNTWTTLESGLKLVDSIFNTINGKVTLKTTKSIPVGQYKVKIVAKDNWDHFQDSNIVSTEQKKTSTGTTTTIKTTAAEKKTTDLDDESPGTSGQKQEKTDTESQGFLENMKKGILRVITSIKQTFIDLLGKLR